MVLGETVLNLNEKLFILFIDRESLTLQGVSPVNRDEMTALKKLNKQGLSKLLVIDTSYAHIFHQNSIRKLITNLSTNTHSMSELNDCTPSNYGVVQIGASNIWYRKLGLSEQEYEAKITEEKTAHTIEKNSGLSIDSILDYIRKHGVALL
jgi:hypothetical protein